MEPEIYTSEQVKKIVSHCLDILQWSSVFHPGNHSREDIAYNTLEAIKTYKHTVPTSLQDRHNGLINQLEEDCNKVITSASKEVAASRTA